MRLCGGIIPWAGFRRIKVNMFGEPVEPDSHEFKWDADAFDVEWLGRGAILFLGKVYPNENKQP